jgi:parallel beta-helix repeat protein
VDKSALTSSDGIWVPDNYTTIQAAIYAAKLGDTIFVKNQTYYENLIINQTIRLIGLDFPTIDGHLNPSFWGLPTISVRAENVTISGFIIQHGFSEKKWKEMDWGIDLWYGSCNISNNIVRFNERGIDCSANNVIENNLITCNYGGITCDGSWNIIKGNNITNNGCAVFFPRRSNVAINNTISNCDFGIVLWCNDTYLRGNNMTGNFRGFDFDGGSSLRQYIQDIDSSNLIDGKPMYYWINEHDKNVPSDAGYVALVNCTNITVSGLDLRKNGHGLMMAFTHNSTVANCNISNNDFGLFMWASENNTIIHNNFVNNTYQVGNPYSSWPPAPELPRNIWDNGYPSGGNFWSPFNVTDLYSGPYQNVTGSDGINDTAYFIDSNNQDNYPLAGPINSFYAGTWNTTSYSIDIISNSTISNFQFNEAEKTITFNVSTLNSTSGFCRVTIPKQLLSCNTADEWQVFADTASLSYAIIETIDNTYTYFTYSNSTTTIQIKATHAIPELRPTVLPILLTLATAALLLEKLNKKSKAKVKTTSH